MFQPDEDTIKILDRLDASYRFRHDTKRGIVCEIVDKTTGIGYADATGPDEPGALRVAAEAALTAPKPLTKAQQADPTYLKAKELEAKVAEQEAELEQLRAQADKPKATKPRAIKREASTD